MTSKYLTSLMKSSIPSEIIENKIYIIRDQKVMFDRDLSLLYGVETKKFLQSVRRNQDRFPKDFAFQLTKDEFEILRSQFVTSSWGGTRYLPMVFTALHNLIADDAEKPKIGFKSK